MSPSVNRPAVPSPDKTEQPLGPADAFDYYRIRSMQATGYRNRGTAVSRRSGTQLGQKALVTATVTMLMLHANLAFGRDRSDRTVVWPVRWSPASRPSPAAPRNESAAVITITAPSSMGVTVGGAPINSSIDVGVAVDALGAPVDLSRFNRMQRAGKPVVVAGQPPRGLPLERAYLTSGFGMRLHPTLGGHRLHRGIDLAAPTGTPIVAPGGGTVTRADWRGGFGLFVEIDHGGGRQSRYGHLSRLNVHPGQQLSGGEVIGYVGSTGRSTGPHLHYEMIEGGRAVDPLQRR